VHTSLTDEILDRGRRERVRSGYPDGFPVLPAVPAARYADEGFAVLEREHVFGRSWLFVAHSAELPEPGDYVLLRQLPQPVLLVRGTDGTIRAFLDACQHRGGSVVADDAGNTGRRLVCGYHAWTYDLEGTLVGLPGAQDFQVDAACLGLPRVRCEQWGSLVFVNLDGDAPPLLDALGTAGRDLHDQIGVGDGVGEVHLVARRAIEVEGNWKLTVDANLETYHVNTVHRNSAAVVLDQAATGIFLLRDGHSRMLVHSRDGKAFPIDLPAFPGASPLAGCGIYSYHLFPNTSVVFGGTPALAFLISSWPLAPDRSLYDVHFLAATPADGPHATLVAALVEANWSVLLEDLGNLPAIQRSVSTGALAGMTLGYQERRLYHQHEELDRRIGAERVPAALRVEPKLADWIEE
jgi:phenylpropionate dioxygenase-like ring-hydroxylating dioxygenase large terminal subunit